MKSRPSAYYPSTEKLMAGPMGRLVPSIGGPLIQSFDGSGKVITRPATSTDIYIDEFWRQSR